MQAYSGSVGMAQRILVLGIGWIDELYVPTALPQYEKPSASIALEAGLIPETIWT
jgi:hypothetical protein